MQDVKPIVQAYIEKNFLLTSGTTIGSADSLLALQILDSTGFLELVGFLESHFGITINDDEMIPENLETIDNIVAYVTRKRGA